MRFVKISREEFDSVILNREDGRSSGFVRRELDGVGEFVYDLSAPNGLLIRVYSSVDIGSGVSREAGIDAIRVCLVDVETNRGIGSKTHTKRTEGWGDRLRRKVNELYRVAKERNVPRCPDCRKLMVERIVRKEGPHKGKKFYGCQSYPNCYRTIWPESGERKTVEEKESRDPQLLLWDDGRIIEGRIKFIVDSGLPVNSWEEKFIRDISSRKWLTKGQEDTLGELEKRANYFESGKEPADRVLCGCIYSESKVFETRRPVGEDCPIGVKRSNCKSCPYRMIQHIDAGREFSIRVMTCKHPDAVVGIGATAKSDSGNFGG